jgi:hypothetical protein
MTGATQEFDDESGVVMTTIECKVIEAMGKVLEYVEADLRQWSAWDYVGPCAEKHTEARGHLDQSVLLVRKWLDEGHYFFNECGDDVPPPRTSHPAQGG